MSDKYKFVDAEGTYFTTTTIVGWVDVFSRPELKQIIVNSLRYCQKEKGLLVHGWCLMPSHLHMICSTDKIELSRIFHDFKAFTSKELIKALCTHP
jgi:REP element-mobilizing transposase RayT